jgi:enamine deaminase RidA (YjgF/YER057c/UK114 family)
MASVNQQEATRPEFIDTPGYGERMGPDYHYSQAVRIGNRIEISGQGGWTDEAGSEFPDDIRQEVLSAFDNVERTLNAAGASWKDVVTVTSYHVSSDKDAIGIDGNVLGQMIEEFGKRMPDRRPVWTTVGASGLASPKMHIELAVTAIASNE